MVAAICTLRLAMVLALGFLMAGCEGKPPQAPEPLVLTPPAPPPPRSPPAATAFMLTGVVTDASARPIPGARVNYLITKPEGDGWAGSVTGDADGRYTVPGIASRSSVRVTAFSTLASGWLTQICATTTTVNHDTELNVELVPLGSPGSARDPNILTGVVFEKTASGVRPRADEWVSFYSVFRGTFDVYTWTDHNGRYTFCRLPSGAGKLGAGACNDFVFHVDVQINSTTTEKDVDLTSFNADCPRTGSRPAGTAAVRR